MKKRLLLYCLMFFGIFTLCPVFADNNGNNYITINNVIPQYSSGYGNYAGNTMCTYGGGFCANSGYMMSTSRVYYAPAQWKRLTLRERRLSLGTERRNYYGY